MVAESADQEEAALVAEAALVVAALVAEAAPEAVVRAVAVGEVARESAMPQYGVSSWRSPCLDGSSMPQIAGLSNGPFSSMKARICWKLVRLCRCLRPVYLHPTHRTRDIVGARSANPANPVFDVPSPRAPRAKQVLQHRVDQIPPRQLHGCPIRTPVAHHQRRLEDHLPHT